MQMKSERSKLIVAVVGILLVAFLILALRAFLYEPFRVPARSMLPTLAPGSFVVVKKWGYGNYSSFGVQLRREDVSAPLERGDIIVFEYPADRSVFYIKRLIGLPGDVVTYRDKKLDINGRPVQQSPAGIYLDPSKPQSMTKLSEALTEAPYQILIDGTATSPGRQQTFGDKCAGTLNQFHCEIPQGHYFVLGDNRDGSSDSRTWGLVPADHIVGKVVYILAQNEGG